MNVRPWFYRERVYTPVPGKSTTQQSFRDSSDVNHIVDRYQRTGSLPSSEREAQFLDCSPLQTELTEAINSAIDVSSRAQAEYQAHLDAQASEPETQPAENAGASPDPEPTTE